MKREILKILACPNCKSQLRLESENEKLNRVSKGKLHCMRCGSNAEIIDEIIYFREFRKNIKKLPVLLEKEVKKEWLKKFSKEELLALRKEWKWMINKLNLEKSKIHLDWATGTGRFLREISSVFQGNVIALEYDRATCIWLKDFLKKIGKYSKVSIVCADARGMPIRSSSIDSVSTWHGLDEPNIKNAINESKRVLRNDGRISASGFFIEKTQKSLRIAGEVGMGLVKKDKAIQHFRKVGFRNIDYKVFFEGDCTEKKSFLPRYGDRYVSYAISGRK